MVDPTVLARAGQELHAGQAVVLPTDTVYGIGALVRSPQGIATIFRLKERPKDKPLPVLAASAQQLVGIAQLGEPALKLAHRFWPGALTIVLRRAPGFGIDLGGSDPESVGVRVPADPVAAEVMARWGPLATTSANRSGEEPARTCDEARAVFGPAVGCYIDDGPRSGAPSTVVSLVGDVDILRPGPIGADEILQALTS